MDLDALKPGDNEPNPPSEPAYSAPRTEEVVLPEENDEPDTFDDEAGVDDENADLADFDAEETNAKEVSE